jgi:hypothetical protein
VLDDLKNRIVQLRAAPAVVARESAPIIEARLKTDATTRRGNVPLYGRMGNVPITAEARPEAIIVRAADWVIKKAVEKDQVEEWVGLVKMVADRVMKRAASGAK